MSTKKRKAGRDRKAADPGPLELVGDKPEPEPDYQVPVAVPVTQPSSLNVDLPVLKHSNLYLTRVDMRITPKQGIALRRLFDGLQANGETVDLVSTVPVSSQADALRWVLDKIAAETD